MEIFPIIKDKWKKKSKIKHVSSMANWREKKKIHT